LIRLPSTAILSQVTQQRIHRVVARGINHGAAVAPYSHQPGLTQPIKVKGQGVRGQFERVSDRPGWHAFPSSLDKKAKDIETIVLRKSGQSR
jgi:hypothetical protein